MSLGSHSVFTTALLLVMAMHVSRVDGASLKPETIAAWDSYVQTLDANLQDRVKGNSFLWTFENEKRASAIRGGAIVIAAAPGQDPKKIPGGLIHHWMGAMFLPKVTIDEVLGVTRNYDRYGEFYRPSIVSAKAVGSDGLTDRFSMLLMNKAFFLKSALDADYEATNVRVNNGRFYSVTRTTRLQEIHEYGQPGEHRLAEGEGGGYIWKIYSINRLEERDGGVYVELEASALSRDIPAAMRLVVSPVVRRVSHNALLISLQQTESAVRHTSAAARTEGTVLSSY